MALAKFHKQCSRNVSGNLHLFLTEATNVYSVTVTSGEVSDIAMVGIETFKEIQCDQNTLKRMIGGARANKSFTNYEHVVEFVVTKASKEVNELSDALDDGQPCGFVAIVVDSNWQAWLVGWSEREENIRPLYPSVVDFDSGVRPADNLNSMTYRLTGLNDEVDLPMNSTINAYILACLEAGTDVGFTP